MAKRAAVGPNAIRATFKVSDNILRAHVYTQHTLPAQRGLFGCCLIIGLLHNNILFI